MNMEQNMVCEFMRKQAQRYPDGIDFFDLRYELSMSTKALIAALTALEEAGEVAQGEGHFYRFTGAPEDEETEKGSEATDILPTGQEGETAGKVDRDEESDDGERYEKRRSPWLAYRQKRMEQASQLRQSSLFDGLDLKKPEPQSPSTDGNDEKKAARTHYDAAYFSQLFEKKMEEHEDRYYLTAIKFAMRQGNVSLSTLQRELCIGYNMAGRLIERMERDGFVSSFDEKLHTRKVLLNEEEFNKRFGVGNKDGAQKNSAQKDGANEEDLYIHALKYAVIRKEITMGHLIDTFSISADLANRLMQRMIREGHLTREAGRSTNYKTLLTREGFVKLYGSLGGGND